MDMEQHTSNALSLASASCLAPKGNERAPPAMTRMDLTVLHEQYLPFIDSKQVPFIQPTWLIDTKPQNYALLDVQLNNEIIQCIKVQEKPAYVIGRNPAFCDVILDHCSISRSHALLAHHVSNCTYIIDFGSSHGTYLNGKKLEPYQPTLLAHASKLRFGVSTRIYIYKSFKKKSEIVRDVESNSTLQTEEEKLLRINTLVNRQLSYRLGFDDNQSSIDDQHKRHKSLCVSSHVPPPPATTLKKPPNTTISSKERVVAGRSFISKRPSIDDYGERPSVGEFNMEDIQSLVFPQSYDENQNSNPRGAKLLRLSEISDVAAGSKPAKSSKKVRFSTEPPCLVE